MIGAWLLDLGHGRLAAVGEREQIHLQHEPVLHRVPATLPHAKEVAVWDGRCLPVVDIGMRVDGRASRGAGVLVGVYAYRAAGESAAAFGALWLAGPPRRVLLADPVAAALPQPRAGWRDVAISCFEHDGVAIPVLDLTKVFAAPVAQAKALLV